MKYFKISEAALIAFAHRVEGEYRKSKLSFNGFVQDFLKSKQPIQELNRANAEKIIRESRNMVIGKSEAIDQILSLAVPQSYIYDGDKKTLTPVDIPNQDKPS